MTSKKLYIQTKDVNFLNLFFTSTQARVSIERFGNCTEYTDLVQLWHDDTELPQEGKQVFAIDYGGKVSCGVFAYDSMYGIFFCRDLVTDWDSVVR